jgi:hypothetical protein
MGTKNEPSRKWNEKWQEKLQSGLLLGKFVDLDDGGDMFHRNVG